MGGNIDFYEALCSIPGTRAHLIKFVGGAAAVTKVFGEGMAVTYIGTGIVDLDFSGNANNPGTFVGMVATFQATTPSGVKGYTVVPGLWNATTKKLRLNITNASEALADLAAAQWLTCIVIFKEPSEF